MPPRHSPAACSCWQRSSPQHSRGHGTARLRSRFRATQQNAAMLLTRRFGCASLVKGGHFVNEANDVLSEPAPLDDEGNPIWADPLTTWFRHKRIETNNTHGTGCTLRPPSPARWPRAWILPTPSTPAKAYLTGASSPVSTWAKAPAPSTTCGSTKQPATCQKRQATLPKPSQHSMKIVQTRKIIGCWRTV